MKNFIIIISLIIIQSSCKTIKPNSNCIGEAKPDCMCTMQYKPVCGCDGKTYSNACVAACAGVKTWTDGECKN